MIGSQNARRLERHIFTTEAQSSQRCYIFSFAARYRQMKTINPVFGWREYVFNFEGNSFCSSSSPPAKARPLLHLKKSLHLRCDTQAG
jgi:hypothetical protein